MGNGVEVLTKFFGTGDLTPDEARIALYQKDSSGYPIYVIKALNDILVQGMGNKTNPHKRDRQMGQNIRKKRTGSRRG